MSYSAQLKTNTNINYYFKVLLLLQKCFLSGSAVTKDISTTTENFAEALPDWKAFKPKHIKILFGYFSNTHKHLTMAPESCLGRHSPRGAPLASPRFSNKLVAETEENAESSRCHSSFKIILYRDLPHACSFDAGNS